MKFIDFQRKFAGSPILYSRDLVRQTPHAQALRNQMSRWQGRKLIVKLRRGIYAFTDPKRSPSSCLEWVANRLYEPSYLSLEFALAFYGLIPERVAEWTSITTLKTARFENELGRFSYRRVKPAAFRGFKKMGNDPQSFFMAEPEKAVVDFLYLNRRSFGKNTAETLMESFRFQNLEELDRVKLHRWGRLFGVRKLTGTIEELCRPAGLEKRG